MAMMLPLSLSDWKALLKGLGRGKHIKLAVRTNEADVASGLHMNVANGTVMLICYQVSVSLSVQSVGRRPGVDRAPASVVGTSDR